MVFAALCARGAPKTDAVYHYLDPAGIDLTVLLPPPPDPGSSQERQDEAQVAAQVGARTSSALVRAQGASHRDVFFFAPSVGDEFTASRFPITAAFFKKIGSDVEKLTDAAKLHWDRPRPDGANKKRGSYPSGHAAFAAAAAIVLAELLPCKRDQIFRQARRFAENRIILGLHYPSDVAAGWTAGTVAAFAMTDNAAFKRDLAAAGVELRRVCPSGTAAP